MKPHLLFFLLLAGCVEPKPAPEVSPQPSPFIAKPEAKKPAPPVVPPEPKAILRVPVCNDIPGDDMQTLNLKLDCVKENK